MKLDARALGLAAGILWAACIFLCTLFVVWRGGGAHLELLQKFYLGYSVSVLGAFVGFLWGFVAGFVTVWLLAWLYNRLARASV